MNLKLEEKDTNHSVTLVRTVTLNMVLVWIKLALRWARLDSVIKKQLAELY